MSRADLDQSVQDLSRVTSMSVNAIENFVQSVRLIYEDLEGIKKIQRAYGILERIASDPNSEIEFIKAGSAEPELSGKDYLELDLDGDTGYHIIEDEE